MSLQVVHHGTDDMMVLTPTGAKRQILHQVTLSEVHVLVLDLIGK